MTHFWLEACIAEWTLVDINSSPTFTPVDAQSPHHGLLGTTPLLRGSIATWAKRPEVRESRNLALKPIGVAATDDDESMMEMDQEGPLGAEDVMMGHEFGGGGEESADRTVQQNDSPTRTKAAIASSAKAPVEMDLSPDAASPPRAKKVVKKVPSNVAMDFDTDSSIVVATVTKKVIAPKTSKRIESPVDEDESLPDEIDELADPTPPRASTSNLLRPAKLPLDDPDTPPAQKKKKQKLDNTPVKIMSSAAKSAKSIPSSHSKPNGLDESLILPLNGRKRAAAGAASENLKHQMLDRNRFEAEQKISSSGRKKRAESPSREEESGGKVRAGKKGKKAAAEEEDDDEESAGTRRVKRVATAKGGKKSVVARLSVIEAGGSGVVSSFDNPPHPTYVPLHPLYSYTR